ncbi:beta-aspartyl-peptidase [Tindallia californiensis]|uniref:Isoaspartyl dipeptidase n=1 Tax=Tindallia californiensis TaxID=159292 RepID=A0A1H3MFV4_9FIRM|nr:beta-aspartyl-peptidase [Tindallia californiensis]SDY75592.1 isoaspartyl dipeptidase. Metallo peptidase. MEROPS family M38 [Tindallia californiensis]
MLLIKNADLYDPEKKGIQDILIAQGKIELVDKEIQPSEKYMQVMDAKGKKIFPGFIDQHVHITGGGGEGGFETKVPEISLSKLIVTGTTTVVGLLGTDASTRNIESLIAKAKALNKEGVTAYAVTGSYEYPTVTLTESVRKDIAFIQEVIGAKVAFSDHRSSEISEKELARLASDVRVAGMISGKAGILVVHMGNGNEGMEPIIKILETTDIPITTIRPTHVNRKKELLEQALSFAKSGGIIDLTCGLHKENPPAKVIRRAKEMGIAPENILLSSDGYGSWSHYDEYGNMIDIGISEVSSLYEEFQQMVMKEKYCIHEALPHFTSYVAKALKINEFKGSVKPGKDADLMVVDEKLRIETVIARGEVMMKENKIIKSGTYE